MKNKNVFKTLNYGLYVVGAKKDKNVGCIINTATQITSEDTPLIMISINKSNFTTKTILETKKFSISVLNTEVNPELIKTFGYNTSEKINKFDNINYEEIDNLPVIKEGVTAYILCNVKEIIDASTHYCILAECYEYNILEEKETLTYKKYQEEIKNKVIEKVETPKNTNTKRYRCKTCGYIYEGELPPNFRCPVCGEPSSEFEEIE